MRISWIQLLFFHNIYSLDFNCGVFFLSTDRTTNGLLRIIYFILHDSASKHNPKYSPKRIGFTPPRPPTLATTWRSSPWSRSLGCVLSHVRRISGPKHWRVSSRSSEHLQSPQLSRQKTQLPIHPLWPSCSHRFFLKKTHLLGWVIVIFFSWLFLSSKYKQINDICRRLLMFSLGGVFCTVLVWWNGGRA